MNYKKTLPAILAIAIIGMNSMPLCAKPLFTRKNNVIQTQVTEYKFTDVNLDWWKTFGDELLEGYIVKAVSQNQDLKIAAQKVEQARQNVKLQFSKELPTAAVGAAPLVYKMSDVTNTESTFGFPIMVQYEADIFLKNHDKTKSAKKTYEVSQFNEKATYIAVASQVGATYFNIVKMDKLISIQENIIASRKQIYGLMRSRNKQGITSTADVTRAEKSYVMGVADLTDLKKTRTVLLNSLAVLTGESPSNIEEFKRISYDELMCKKPIPKEISSEIITQRPDYMAAEHQVEKAGIDVRVAKKEFLPKIDILGLLFFNTNSLGAGMNWTSTIAALGGQAMLPLFTGGANTANLKMKKSQYEEILQNYYKTNLVAIQEVNDSLSGLKLDNEKYIKNVKSYDMQKSDYNYMKDRYKQGIISNLDLLQQKETLLVMDEMVANSRTSCFIDQISLYKAVGGKL